MKKILYIWKDKYPWDVRVEKFCRSLADFGFDVRLLCRWKGETSEFENDGPFQIKRAFFGYSNLKSQPLSINPFWKAEIKKNIIDFKPDLIITREFFLTSVAKNIAKKYSIPVILDMAEHYPAAMKGWDKYSNNSLLRIAVHELKIPELLERKAILASDGIVVISQELKERLINRFGYSEDKIVIVHNTPDLNTFNDIINIRHKPAENFAYHGFMSNDRNLEFMVAAFIEALKVNKNIKLFVAGVGEPFSKIKSMVDSSHVQDNIILYGPYNQSELKDFLKNTDVAILPYKKNEFINHIISNKLFDYMAAGIPVIVSDVIPMKRIVEETGCGISFDCNDLESLKNKILQMSESDNSRYSSNGLEWSKKKYNWSIDFGSLILFIGKYY